MSTKKSMETIYTETVPIEHREKYAQFFTPYPIVKVMAKWLLGNNEIYDILEPAFGLGIFSRELLSKKDSINIKGFEIDNIIYKQAKKIFSGTDKVKIILKDYMFNDWQNKYDGIICTPPYFKFHDYDNLSVINEIEKKLNYKLSGFTNLYTLFLLKSIYQLKPNGRCAYIIPSEFLNSDYGRLVKEQLIKTGSLRHIFVINFEENIFNDALTTASILLCANDNITDKVQFTYINSIAELNKINNIIDIYPEYHNESKVYALSELDPNLKWKTYYQTQNCQKYKNLVPFSNYAKVVRGIATGANDYFTFNNSKAEKYGIKKEYLLPCICHSNDVKVNIFKEIELNELIEKDKNIFLLNVKDAADKNVKKYLNKGIDENIHEKYLTKSRNPWYILENRPPSPIWVSVFNRKGLRFIRNEANISNLTTFHCIYPEVNLLNNVSIDLLFAYLLTDTARLIFEDNSREYGNGLQKFEPNDLNKGKMLDIHLLPEKEKRKAEEFYHKYKKDYDPEYIKKIELIFTDYFS